ncbi:nicotinamidase-related amidase [Pseudarthrobacter enclensis]|uniref:Nicotinamidase-related amidase n=2 Tax=Pseudarthrobacter enclensis TaxID=993070 RepID=A0ABT9RWT6_9MICC|nr:nicotinamidase-related amidase [Pseudarthrobacter enclensis]
MLSSTVPWQTDRHCWEDISDDSMRKIYTSYERPLGVGPRPAVLAIDLYNLVFEGGPHAPEDLCQQFPSTCGRYAHAALGPITEVLSHARAVGMPVVHITASRAKTLSATNRKGRGGGEAYEFHPLCAPKPGEAIIEKERASAFYGTQLVAELVRQGIDTVIVIGESTSGCVRASVVDAYSNGFHVAVVEDAVFDRSWLNHCVNLFDMHHKYADVLSSETLLKLLVRR